MDDAQKIILIKKELKEYLDKESDISKKLEKHIITLHQNLKKLENETPKNSTTKSKSSINLTEK